MAFSSKEIQTKRGLESESAAECLSIKRQQEDMLFDDN